MSSPPPPLPQQQQRHEGGMSLDGNEGLDDASGCSGSGNDDDVTIASAEAAANHNNKKKKDPRSDGSGGNNNSNSNKDAEERLLGEALELVDAADRANYERALRNCPASLLRHESDPSLFLRACGGDPWKAARRLVDYWNERVSVFGPDRAFLPLVATAAPAQAPTRTSSAAAAVSCASSEGGTGGGCTPPPAEEEEEEGATAAARTSSPASPSALSPEDVEVLETGSIQLLPPDKRGRPVVFLDRSRLKPHMQHMTMSRLRVLWYVLQKALMAQLANAAAAAATAADCAGSEKWKRKSAGGCAAGTGDPQQQDEQSGHCIVVLALLCRPPDGGGYDWHFPRKCLKLADVMPCTFDNIHLLTLPTASGTGQLLQAVVAAAVNMLGGYFGSRAQLHHGGVGGRRRRFSPPAAAASSSCSNALDGNDRVLVLKELKKFGFKKGNLPKCVGGSFDGFDEWLAKLRRKEELVYATQEQLQERKRLINKVHSVKKRQRRKREFEELNEQVELLKRDNAAAQLEEQRLRHLLMRATSLPGVGCGGTTSTGQHSPSSSSAPSSTRAASATGCTELQPVAGGGFNHLDGNGGGGACVRDDSDGEAASKNLDATCSSAAAPRSSGRTASVALTTYGETGMSQQRNVTLMPSSASYEATGTCNEPICHEGGDGYGRGTSPVAATNVKTNFNSLLPMTAAGTPSESNAESALFEPLLLPGASIKEHDTTATPSSLMLASVCCDDLEPLPVHPSIKQAAEHNMPAMNTAMSSDFFGGMVPSLNSSCNDDNTDGLRGVAGSELDNSCSFPAAAGWEPAIVDLKKRVAQEASASMPRVNQQQVQFQHPDHQHHSPVQDSGIGTEIPIAAWQHPAERHDEPSSLVLLTEGIHRFAATSALSSTPQEPPSAPTISNFQQQQLPTQQHISFDSSNSVGQCFASNLTMNRFFQQVNGDDVMQQQQMQQAMMTKLYPALPVQSFVGQQQQQQQHASADPSTRRHHSMSSQFECGSSVAGYRQSSP